MIGEFLFCFVCNKARLGIIKNENISPKKKKKKK